ETVGGRPGEFAVAVIIEDALETRPRRGRLVQRPITFRQIKISASPTGRAWILREKFFVFRRSEIENLPGEKPVCVIELPAIGRFRLRPLRFRIVFIITRLRRGVRFRRTASRLAGG